MSGVLNISSSDSDMIVKLGLDPTQFQAGAAAVDASAKGVDDTLRKLPAAGRAAGAGLTVPAVASENLGRRLPVVNEKLLTVSNSMLALSGVGGSTARVFTLVAHGANLAQQGMAGLIGPIGLAVTALGFLTTAVVSYMQSAKEAAKTSVMLGESLAELHEQAISAQELTKPSTEGVEQLLRTRIAETQVFIQQMLHSQSILIANSAGASEHLNKVIEEATRTLHALETELSALQLRVLLKGSEDLQKFLEAARAGIEDLPTPGLDFTQRTSPGPEFIQTPISPEGTKYGPPRTGTMTSDQMQAEWKEVQAEILKAEKQTKAWTDELGTSLARSLSRGFVDAFLAGEDAFKALLASMAKELAAAAVFKLLTSIFNPAGSIIPIPQLPHFQTGTSFVPSTGLAMLHRGEAVIPANQNVGNTATRHSDSGSSFRIDQIIIQGVQNLPELVKQIETMARTRRSRIALVG